MHPLVAFVGDTHGNLKFMWRLATEWQKRTGRTLDAIFQVGDFGLFPSEDRLDPPTRKHAQNHGYPLSVALGDFPEVLSGAHPVPIPTYFIRGNHEDQDFLLNLQKQKKDWYLSHPAEVVPNLYYVPDGCIFQLGLARIAGWGGCWGKNTWEMGYWSAARLQSDRRKNHMTRDVFERLRREKFDVLVTHDAPTGVGLKGMQHPDKSLLDPESISDGTPDGPGMPHIRQLIEEVQPRFHFSGHWHEYHRAEIGRCLSFVLDKTIDDGRQRRCMEVVEL